MTNIPGLKSILNILEDFILWVISPSIPDFDMPGGPLGQMVDFVSNDPIIFIFVVAVPLCGLGIGLLNRLIKA